jgi:hypothetical protein
MDLPYGDFLLQIQHPEYRTFFDGNIDGNRTTRLITYQGGDLLISIIDGIVGTGNQLRSGTGGTIGNLVNGYSKTLCYIRNCIFQNTFGNSGSGDLGGIITNATLFNTLITSVTSRYYFFRAVDFINSIIRDNLGSVGEYFTSTCIKNTSIFKNTPVGSNLYFSATGSSAINCVFNSISQVGGNGTFTYTNCMIKNSTISASLINPINCIYKNNIITNLQRNCVNTLFANNSLQIIAGTHINSTIVKNIRGSLNQSIITEGIFRNTVIWGNVDTLAGENLIPIPSGLTITNSAIENQLYDGIGNIEISSSNNDILNPSPYFILPTNLPGNSGESSNYDITEDSALIDAGDNTLNTTGTGGSFDLGGRPRRSGNGIDIGAYEFQQP